MVKRLVNENFARWKLIPCCYFNNFGKDHLIFKMNIDQKCQFPYMDNSKISLLYKEVVLSWHTTNIVNCPPTNVFQIKTEIIWGNRYISNKNKSLYMKRWIQADCNGSDNELSEQSYVQSRSMRDRPVRHFARCYSLGF